MKDIGTALFWFAILGMLVFFGGRVLDSATAAAGKTAFGKIR